MAEQKKTAEKKVAEKKVVAKKVEKPAEQKKASNVRAIVILVVLLAALVTVVVLAVMFVTGALGGKTLSCTTEQGSDGEKQTIAMDYEFNAKGDKLRKVWMETAVEAKDAETADQYEEEARQGLEDTDSYDEFHDKGGVTTIKRVGNKVIATVSGGVDAWESLGMVENADEMTYDMAKEELNENTNWVCE